MDIERKLATIETIQDIQPIENADNIEKARIRGWWVVIQKNSFKIGDPCVYFEIDSLLPINNKAFDGLDKYNSVKSVTINGIIHTGYRIKTVKLRGQVSQGLILPANNLFFLTNEEILTMVGADVTNILDIVKYEKQESINGTQGQCRSTFPTFIPKTDEERVQNIPIYKIQNYVFKRTEKLDGTSFTAYKKDGFFGVCSRNRDLIRDDVCLYWRMAYKYNLEEIIQENTSLQGEIVGPGIQGNKLKLKEQELRIFNIYDIENSKYIEITDQIKQELNTLQFVPDLYDIYFNENEFKNTDDIVNLANKQKSKINPNVNAEGSVFVRFDSDGNKISFKAINNAYLLSEKD